MHTSADLISKFKEHLAVLHRSPGTISCYADEIGRFLKGNVDIKLVTNRLLEDYISGLYAYRDKAEKPYSINTICSKALILGISGSDIFSAQDCMIFLKILVYLLTVALFLPTCCSTQILIATLFIYDCAKNYQPKNTPIDFQQNYLKINLCVLPGSAVNSVL